MALCVGALVCIAAANAGATSQDLKTGFLVGATPRAQQIGLLIGVITSTIVVGLTIRLLDDSGGPGVHMIGSDRYPAPQATLMATLIKGLLAHNLDWQFVMVGVALALTVELCGVSSLSFAVGAYLPLSTTAPIFVGGAVRAFAERARRQRGTSRRSPGSHAGGRARAPAACSRPAWSPAAPVGGRVIAMLSAFDAPAEGAQSRSRWSTRSSAAWAPAGLSDPRAALLRRDDGIPLAGGAAASQICPAAARRPSDVHRDDDRADERRVGRRHVP
jgi:hypothetical protein